MHRNAFLAWLIVFTAPAGTALAQDATSSPMVADRPGLLFSSVTVGRGVFQAELGLPQVTFVKEGELEARTASLVALVRIGLGDDFELRLGAPVYNHVRTDFGPFDREESGFGDVEVGAKWHIADNAGARPSFALIPSVIVPTGEEGFSAEDPVYQLNAIAEWTLAGGWGLGALVGLLNGPAADGRTLQETLALSAGRSLPAPAWSAYGEAAWVTSDLAGAGDSAFLGAGVKYLSSDDVQVDLSFDRGLTDTAADWLFGFGVSVRF